MMKSNKKIFPALGVILAMLATAWMGSARTSWDDAAQRRKADYLFMEGRRQMCLDNFDGAFAVEERAFQLDTTDVDVGGTLGYYYYLLSEEPVLLDKGLSLMRRCFDANPRNEEISVDYGGAVTRMHDTREALRVWGTLDSIFPNKEEYSFEYIDALLEAGDTADILLARQKARRLQVAIGATAIVTSREVMSHMLLQDTVGAVGALHNLIAEAPLNVGNHIFVGQFFLNTGMPDSALVYFDRACELDSANGEAVYARAEFYRQIGDTLAFNREFLRAIHYPDLDMEAKKNMVTRYVGSKLSTSQKEDEFVDNVLQAVTETHPHEAHFRMLYAVYLDATGQHDKAEEQYEILLDIDPSNPDAWIDAATNSASNNNLTKAEGILKRGIEVHPDNAELHQVLASVMQMQERWGDAEAELLRSLEMVEADNYDVRSVIYGMLGDAVYNSERPDRLDDAYGYYEKALNENPFNYLVLNNYAYFMVCNGGDIQKAETMSYKTVTQAPTNSIYLDTYAWIIFVKGDYAKAKDYIDKALQNAEDGGPDVNMLDHAGDIYYMNDLTDEAVEFWQKALELDPENSEIKQKIKQKKL